MNLLIKHRNNHLKAVKNIIQCSCISSHGMGKIGVSLIMLYSIFIRQKSM